MRAGSRGRLYDLEGGHFFWPEHLPICRGVPADPVWLVGWQTDMLAAILDGDDFACTSVVRAGGSVAFASAPCLTPVWRLWAMPRVLRRSGLLAEDSHISPGLQKKKL